MVGNTSTGQDGSQYKNRFVEEGAPLTIVVAILLAILTNVLVSVEEGVGGVLVEEAGLSCVEFHCEVTTKAGVGSCKRRACWQATA